MNSSLVNVNDALKLIYYAIEILKDITLSEDPERMYEVATNAHKHLENGVEELFKP
jgi:hypothetical protein